VALAVIGLALPALLLLVQQQMDGASHIRNKTYAQWVAVNQLTDMRVAKRVTGQIPSGRNSGEQAMLGRTWYWHSTTEQTSEEQFYRIEMKVGLTESEQESLVSLIGFIGREQ